MRYLLAGGGTAGHVNPLLALAEAIRQDQPDANIYALGTAEGLEARLVPERGFELLTIEKVPFPRRPNAYAISFFAKFAKGVRACRREIRDRKIDVVVGFGGYASAPAYLAAALEKVPLVIHEANALPGLANRLGARFAKGVAVAFKNTDLPNSVHTGMPLREEILRASAKANVADARKHFGLATDAPTLLVTGGSLGAQKINQILDSSIAVLEAAGIQVLHIVGGNSDLAPLKRKGYVRISYCERMDLAILAADFAVSRAGASTVSEFSALGLPALYIPYAVGNGEQAKNIAEVLAAGGALTVADSVFSRDYIANQLVPLISNSKRLAAMAAAAKKCGNLDGTNRLLAMVKGVLPA
jgi:UDP-N-acetylglucosamine--N-acetylmuramyl-(pentapeptide) pyrophosphoryl-undecaprenol N-acetylglucosamine transferase